MRGSGSCGPPVHAIAVGFAVPLTNPRQGAIRTGFLCKLAISGSSVLRTDRMRPRNRKVKIMPLIQLVEVLIVVGVLLWLVNRFIPMQGSIKSILNGVVVIAVVLWVLNVFGLFHSLSRIRVGS
jgi:hypothetical protein